MTTLDNLKKSAKRWLKALRDGDVAARERLRLAWPGAPREPVLRDVQHALARELGYVGWTALAGWAGQQRSAGTPAQEHDLVAHFVEFACWDHHTHGAGDYSAHAGATARILRQHPNLARQSLYTACVCSDMEEVARLLAERPEAAREPGGPRGWAPILYLCYARVPTPPAGDHSVAIARALLDHGADPNAFYMAGDAKYSALVGVAGDGEQDAPAHPRREELFELLLQRGAHPYDIQVLYNTHFRGDMIWWLELIHAHAVRTGRMDEWRDPDWAMLDMGGYGSGARFILNTAIQRGNPGLAEWALAHGANPNAAAARDRRAAGDLTLHEFAATVGESEIVETLLRHGAREPERPLDADAAFMAACMRLDRAAAHAAIDARPERLRSHRELFEAAERDRPDVIGLLLDLGVPIEVENRSAGRALHAAAGANALRAAAFLVERGAEIDPRERQYNNTPLGWAAHYHHREMLDFLSRHSRDVWNLAFCGHVDRLRDVLAAEPRLATAASPRGLTPLWWLPDDEERAVEVVELLLACGADPSVRAADGSTAADYARRRGLEAAAKRLGIFGEPRIVAAPTVEECEGVARDLVVAYDSGDQAAMARLTERYVVTFTWEELRSLVAKRLEAVDESRRPEGDFALPHSRLIVALQAGFEDWDALAASLSGQRGSPTATLPSVASAEPDLAAPGMILPPEMAAGFAMRLFDGSVTTTADVWAMLVASGDGDLVRVQELASSCPSLVRCDYNYMPPLHLAVREGHVDVVRFLAEQGAANPNHETYPYRERLTTVAEDRGYADIARVLREHYAKDPGERPSDEGGEILYQRDEERVRFQKVVANNGLSDARRLLDARPELALDPFAFWGEGIMSMPANRGDRRMLELLLQHGARVPRLTKWGAWYYFKRYEIAAFLMDRGMDALHMNCHHTTLLHDMAYTGDLQKATLLLDHGADVDAIDEEFQSTPLGLAARWGHVATVKLLLDRGADRARAGAAWATPAAWARLKGHREIEALL